MAGGMSAEYALPSVINAALKSGSNQFHGSAYEYLRNEKLQARNFFAARVPPLKRNQFGGTLGGKIIRDKLFFFGGYQGTRTRSNPPQTISYVPTAAALAGDFSTLESASCQSNQKPKTLIDPLTKKAFPGNKIDVTRFDPAAVKLVSFLPAAATPCGQVTYGIPQAQDEDQIIGKVDYVRSEKHSLFGRYFVADYRSPAFWNPNNILWTASPGNLERSHFRDAGACIAEYGSQSQRQSVITANTLLCTPPDRVPFGL